MPKVLSTSVNADGGPHFEILTNAGFDIEAVDRGVDLFVDYQFSCEEEQRDE